MEFLKNLLTLRERYPDIFIAKHVDPRTRTRTVPMRVLCLGMSRNGTMCRFIHQTFYLNH